MELITMNGLQIQPRWNFNLEGGYHHEIISSVMVSFFGPLKNPN